MSEPEDDSSQNTASSKATHESPFATLETKGPKRKPRATKPPPAPVPLAAPAESLSAETPQHEASPTAPDAAASVTDPPTIQPVVQADSPTPTERRVTVGE